MMTVFVPQSQRLKFLKYCRMYKIKFKYIDKGNRLFYRIPKLLTGQAELLNFIVRTTKSKIVTDEELQERMARRLGSSHRDVVELSRFAGKYNGECSEDRRLHKNITKNEFMNQ